MKEIPVGSSGATAALDRLAATPLPIPGLVAGRPGPDRAPMAWLMSGP
ncbi:hypothetical protein [Streptomyces sp.]